MTRRSTLIVGLGLLAIAAAFEIGPRATMSFVSMASATPPTPPPSGPLMWTAELIDQGTQCWHVTNAASWVGPAENGEFYDDWRLPTIAELQAALQAEFPETTFGDTSLTALGNRIWSASGSGGCGTGSWAYCTKLYTDANGVPIPPSGEAKIKEPKNGILRAKYVRP